MARKKNRPVGGRGKQNKTKVLRVPLALVHQFEAEIEAFYQKYGHYINLPIKGTWWEVLGLSPSASAKEVSEARKTLLWLYHPDRYKEKDAHERAAAINQAYSEYLALN